MYVHEEKKTAFVAHPRTASSATGHVLLQLGFEQQINHHDFEPKMLGVDWTVISTVRNPFDVMVSWYYHYVRKSHVTETFREWLPGFLKMSNRFIDRGMFFGAPYCTHLLFFESLQDDFNYVMSEIGLPQTEIPQRNVSTKREGRHWQTYYDDAAVHLVVEHFATEINVHGYSVPNVTGMP